MKLRWWILGTAAVIAGGALALKHFGENKGISLAAAGEENEKLYGASAAGVPESDFDEIDFLA